MRRWLGLILTAAVLTLASLTTFGHQPTALAATCTVTTTADGRPYIAATATGPGTGKKIGFDNTHEETAGAADWVINGGFNHMACALAGQGYNIEEIRAYPLVTATLNQYDVVVIPEPNNPMLTSEESALASYVAGGGGLLLVADHYQADRNYNTWDATEVLNGWRRGHYQVTYTSPLFWNYGTQTSSTYTFNNEDDWLANNFGLRFHFSAVDMASGVTGFTAGNPSDPDDPGILPPASTFNLTQGVSSVSLHAGATLSIVDPTKAMGVVYTNKNSLVMWAHAQTNDPIAVYTDNVGTPACGSVTLGGRCEGPFVVVSKPNAGKVAAVGDSSTFESGTPASLREDNGGSKTIYSGWEEVNNAQLGINLVNWLATKDSTVGIPSNLQQQASPEPYNVFTISEPLAEPWTTVAGYNWYDNRTFASGSYVNNTVYNPPSTSTPTVSITAPANGATVSGTTTVSASASDSTGVTKVEFYLDGALQSTVTSSPYNWSWNTTNASNGSHSLVAKAYNAAGGVGTSSTVSVTVSNTTSTPTVSITAPANGATVSGTTTVTASASDSTGVTKVEFYLDGTLQSTVTNSPYNWSWNTTTSSNGSHSLVAKAYNAAGGVGTSSTVSVTVSNTTSTPTVSITAPANGATVSGATTVSASASDSTGVTKVEFYLDNALQSTVTASPYNWSWDTTTASNGSHSLVVKAYNAAGGVGTSSTVSVTVSNSTTSGTANETFTGTLSSSPTTTDFWIDVTATGTISLNLSWAQVASLNIYLYNPSGTQVANVQGKPSPETLTYNATTTGRYRVHVTRSSGGSDFTLTESHPINPSVTAAYSQSGSLATGGTQNYSLSVGGSGTIDLSLSYPSGANYNLYLINSAGTTVASATSTTLNPQSISYQVSGAGTYTVQVQAASGSGSYTLSGYYPK